MVTLTSAVRLIYIKNSIAAFCAQTYPHRELVIVQEQNDAEARAELAAYVAGLGRDDIRLVDAPPGLTLGALRNLSRRAARGEVHCQWDDDDLYHAERIDHQLTALLELDAEAVGLEDTLQFFPASRELYWTNWRATPATILPGSIMYWANAPISYPESGPEARLGEDSAVCDQLLSRGKLGALAGSPHLFVYMSHGANSWAREHHLMLAEQLGLSRGLLRRREPWIREAVAQIDLGPGPVSVRGPNGEAFILDR